LVDYRVIHLNESVEKLIDMVITDKTKDRWNSLLEDIHDRIEFVVDYINGTAFTSQSEDEDEDEGESNPDTNDKELELELELELH
jgi:hypothetical protein